MLVAITLWDGAITEDTTGVGGPGALASARSAAAVKGIPRRSRLVGGKIACTAISGATQTLDAKIQTSPGDGTWIDCVTFTQLTGTGAENKGLLAAYTTLLNPSGANPNAVGIFGNLRVNLDIGAGTTGATARVDAWFEIDP